jgi:Uma2 family endonuclease
MTLVAPQPVTAPSAPPEPAVTAERRVLLEGISWATYERLLHDIGDGHVRLTYDCGRLEIMSPGDTHQGVKTVAARIVEMYAFLAGIPIHGYGSMTMRREALQKGLEPDECYYVSSFSKLPENGTLDIAVDPPPDLAIEVDISRPDVAREPIYAALGVREVWLYDGRRFGVLRRDAAGHYEAVPQSQEFPDLPVDDFNRFVQIGLTSRQPAAIAALVDWFNAGRARQP